MDNNFYNCRGEETAGYRREEKVSNENLIYRWLYYAREVTRKLLQTLGRVREETPSYDASNEGSGEQERT
jgi:hypothetical protein